METVIDCVVALVDQRYEVALLEVSVTLPPEPEELIVGVAGAEFTVTLFTAEVVHAPGPRTSTE